IGLATPNTRPGIAIAIFAGTVFASGGERLAAWPGRGLRRPAGAGELRECSMEQESPSRKPRRASQSVLDTLATEAASDQPTPEEVEGAPGAPAKARRSAAGAPPAALDRLIEQLRSTGVDAVFGKPQQVGEQTLIPVASITYGLGFGRGRGRREPAES